jgi:ABC-type Zn uptake system ZnuABC Zn-binding protein ZnuA
VAGLGLGGCSSRHSGDERPVAAVTSSYFECILADLAGDDWRVARLTTPGSCPGHFDMEPSKMRDLEAARLVVRFGVEKSLDPMLARLGPDGPEAIAIEPARGLAVPATYAETARRVAEALAAADPAGAASYRERAGEVERRMNELADSLGAEIERAGLAGAATAATSHQADFARSLGLDVAVEFNAADDRAASVSDAMEKARAANVRFVIANRPEGTRTAEALARRLGARLVVFENFPAVSREEPTFDAMVRRNVARLVEGAGQ